MASLVVRCVFGPRLYRLYGKGEIRGHDYEANRLERHSDTVVKWVNFFWNVGWYMSPGIGLFLYRRGYFCPEGLLSLAKFAGSILVLLFGAVCVRGIGRLSNPEYRQFLKILHDASVNNSPNAKKLLSQYDFHFKAWPVDFRWDELENDEKKTRLLSKSHKSRGLVEHVKGLPCQVLSYILVHTFGRRMIYPGSLSLLAGAVGPMLFQGRAKLCEQHNGIRAKLLARDNNEIDTMFVDRRNQKEHFNNGNILVVCCEGNAGFYEVGCMCTPLEGGYSVLGWNHPGFAGSTGVPYPVNEANAVDVVMQYAIEKLGFKVDDIVIFAWSIGGYSATLAAMNYPDIKAVVLDATFDDIVPLAISKMPNSWKGLIIRSMRDYFNLNIADQLCQYPGPIRLIRRSKDEIITTEEGVISTNRGNFLLIKLLQCRYPKLMTEESISVLNTWLSVPDTITQLSISTSLELDESECLQILQSYVEENSTSYPMLIGDDLGRDMKMKLVLFLASKYLGDFDSTHCTPLPASIFALPWSLDEEFLIYDGEN